MGPGCWIMFSYRIIIKVYRSCYTCSSTTHFPHCINSPALLLCFDNWRCRSRPQFPSVVLSGIIDSQVSLFAEGWQVKGHFLGKTLCSSGGYWKCNVISLLWWVERDIESQQQERETDVCCWTQKCKSDLIWMSTTVISQFSLKSIISQEKNWAIIPLSGNKSLFA